MGRFLFLALGVSLALLAVFGLAHWAGLTVLVNAAACTDFLLGRGRWLAGVVGVGLLVVDVFLPVVSSVVILGLGRLFGTVGGGLLALAGSLGAAWLGYAVGRAGGPRLDRLVSPEERERLTGWLQRWGWLVVVVTRPIPILAETVAILAGVTRMKGGALTLGVVAGMTPPAFLYAWAGAQATDWMSGVWIFLAVLAVAGLGWWLGRRWPGGGG